MDVFEILSKVFWTLFPFVLALWTTLTVRFASGYKFQFTRKFRTALQKVFVSVFVALWMVALTVYFWLPLVSLDL